MPVILLFILFSRVVIALCDSGKTLLGDVIRSHMSNRNTLVELIKKQNQNRKPPKSNQRKQNSIKSARLALAIVRNGAKSKIIVLSQCKSVLIIATNHFILKAKKMF